MSLATVDADGLPDVRTVLLKGIDERGFVFYTNTESQKGQELAANPRAGLLFYWKCLNRQVRIRGPVERVTPQEADAYFESRPKAANRRLGEPAIAVARKPLRLREGGRALRCEICPRRGATPAALVRLPHRAAQNRVLAGPAFPTARPGGVPPRRAGRGVVEDAAVSVKVDP